MATWAKEWLRRGFWYVTKRVLWLLTLPSRRRPVRRSLWAGMPILTLPIKARAESLLGVQAESLVYTTFFITKGFTYDLSRWPQPGSGWRRTLLTHLVLIWACLRYQRFHFFYDRGLLDRTRNLQFHPFELSLLRYLGKEVYFYAYGADVRTREVTQKLGPTSCCTECPAPQDCCVCIDEIAEQNFQRIRQHATEVFSMGDMIHYTPGSRNDLFYWPIDLDSDQGRKYAPAYPDPASTAPIRIVHAPNHRAFKGSGHLIAAVEKLRAEGLPVELKLVEKVPNAEALEIYRTADIVFDQCLIGFHGYFALEALALGKPVMVFIRDPERYLLHPEECPFVNSPADRLGQVLRELIRDRQKLHDLGVAGRRYIEKHFTLRAFAKRLERAYREVAAAGRGKKQTRTVALPMVSKQEAPAA